MKLLTSSQHFSGLPTDQLIIQNNTFAYLNNMGCLYLKLERYSASLTFFQKAITYLEAFKESSSREDVDVDEMLISLLHQNEVSIYYNCGLSLLFTKRFVDAYCCFIKVIDIWDKNETQRHSNVASSIALALIRLGECCLGTANEREVHNDLHKKSSLNYLSDGPLRRIVLST